LRERQGEWRLALKCGSQRKPNTFGAAGQKKNAALLGLPDKEKRSPFGAALNPPEMGVEETSQSIMAFLLQCKNF